MLGEQWYFPSDKALFQERETAKGLCYQFNQQDPRDRKASRASLKKLLPNAKSCWIEANFFCDYGYNIYAKPGLYANHGVTILDAAPVNFGEKVLLGPGVIIATATHPKDPELRAKGLEIAHPINIGDNVWIGMGAKILPGVAIGDNAIVGAGAVVTKNVDVGQTVAGVPAKPV